MELLVVISIIVVMLSISIPAMYAFFRGRSLYSAGETVRGGLLRARGNAINRKAYRSCDVAKSNPLVSRFTVASGTRFSTDFDDGDVSSWQRASGTWSTGAEGLSYQVVASNWGFSRYTGGLILGDYLQTIKSTPTVFGGGGQAYAGGPSVRNVLAMPARIQTNGADMYLAGRWEGGGSAQFFVLKRTSNGATWTSLDTQAAAAGNVVDTCYVQKLCVSEYTISYKCWPDGTTEPDWQIVATDPDNVYATGAPGLAAFDTTTDCDDLAIADADLKLPDFIWVVTAHFPFTFRPDGTLELDKPQQVAILRNTRLGELIDDKNGNGAFDFEPFDDGNGNRKWDAGESHSNFGLDGIVNTSDYGEALSGYDEESPGSDENREFLLNNQRYIHVNRNTGRIIVKSPDFRIGSP